MNFGRINTATCVNTAPETTTDPRCSDPAFRLANPNLCPVQTELVIKPGVAMACVFGSIQFKAYTVQNGVETDVTGEAIFSSSNLNVGPVGAMSGNATGLSPGVATICASYEGMTATAQFTVMDCDNGAGCEIQTVAMMVMVDDTRSMSLGFDGAYGSRLAFAKAAATRFISEVNPLKDLVGLMSFTSEDYDVLASPSANIAATGALVPGIAQTQDKTAFYHALSAAIDELAATGADRQVIVLISDGESTAGTDTGSENPFTLLSNFKAAGGIVMCLGCRAAGVGFATLSTFSTGGFFINAYSGIGDTSLDYLSGLKGYICAGNCTPEGDMILSTGTINYTGFINWDVIGGYVDLQGNGFFDYLPGNGLYVDLISGAQPSGAPNGVMQSKAAFTTVAGHVYRLTVELAGNQLTTRAADTVRICVFYLNTDADSTPIYLLDQTVSIADYTQDFHPYVFNFTADAAHDVYISVNQEDIPLDVPPGAAMAGVLLNLVKFEDRTNLTVLLEDDFDTEHSVYIPPACGQGSVYAWLPDLNQYGYAVGNYCYGDGCLDEPPPTQVPDPTPLSNIETGTAPPQPITYTSTKTECVTCESGSENLTEDLIPILADGDTDATASSEADNGSGIIDYAWQAFDGTTAKKWTSQDDVPQWLQIDLGAATTATWYGLTVLASSRPTIWQVQGSNDALTWTTLDQQTDGSALIPLTETKFKLPVTGAYRYYRLYVSQVSNAVTPPGESPIWRVAILEFSLYGNATETQCATATATSEVSQVIADDAAVAAARLAAQALLSCSQSFTSVQSYTAHCPYGTLGSDVTRSATATSTISQDDADNKAYEAAKADAESALSCGQSNNGQQIVINDCLGGTPAQATPYPSVRNVTGVTGVVTKVTVSINNLSHPVPDDILMLLRGPDGTTCLLMANCGGTNVVSNIDLVFDDTGAALPNSTVIASGTYAPTQYAPYADLPVPGPTSPYGTTLAVFNGINPNGSWSLWVADDASGDVGTIADWDITITTADGNAVYVLGDTLSQGYDTVGAALAALVAPYDTFLMLGDNRYNMVDGITAWQKYWALGFGDLVARTMFTPGNHDWTAQSADVKLKTQQFWGNLLSIVYGEEFPATVLVTDPDTFNYSYKIGDWKIVCFNSEAYQDEAGALDPGGSVYDFLDTELSEAGYNFVLMSHRPRWSSDTSHGDNADLDNIWQLACTKGVTLWVAGHSHVSEIQAPRDSSGNVAAGPSQIIAGAGCESLYNFDAGYLAGAVLWNDNSEVLMCRLSLKAASVDVVFIDAHGTPVAASATTISV